MYDGIDKFRFDKSRIKVFDDPNVFNLERNNNIFITGGHALYWDELPSDPFANVRLTVPSGEKLRAQ